MLARLSDQLRFESRFAMHISRRDLPKRIAGYGSMALIVWIGGVTTGLLFITFAVVMCEAAAKIVGRRLQSGPQTPSTGLAVGLLAIHVGSTIAYLGAPLLLAAQPSLALLLFGFTYVFGVSVHVSNTFVALPVFNWFQMTPVFLVALGVILVASRTEYQPSDPFHWWIAAAMMAVYAANAVQTVTQQKDTQAKLDAARAEAAARMTELEHLTRHDRLTGLFNRQTFDDGLARLVAEATPDRQVAVYLIDLDGFKPINDTYGHSAGDAVLVAVARRIAQVGGATGLSARLGGDEFALALPALGSAQGAMRVAQVLVREICRPLIWHEKPLTVSASIGVGLTGIVGTQVADLCSAADQAMYRAKGTMNRTMMFQPGAFPRRLTLDDRQAMTGALLTRAIRPQYQPKVHLTDGRVVGLEALARWQHPRRGLLGPAHFLEQVNELGLQGEFMVTITGQALADIDTMLAQGLNPGQVSVNLPEVALATHTGRADLHRLIASHPCAARHLTLEITEDVFVARSADAIQLAIAEFRGLGLRISLDDFGTGFASFQHLRQFDIDELKIAPGFVADLGHDTQAEVLVRGFLDIATGMGLDVIAEGIETEAQRRILVGLGARVGQGWLFGRAMPLDETCILLSAEAARPNDSLAASRIPVTGPG